MQMGVSASLGIEVRKVSVMIFAGDSITQSGEYVNNIMMQYPTSLILNKGTNGFKIFDLEQDWDNICLEYNPDVVTILVGVNEVIDTMRGSTETETLFEQSYSRLIEKTLAETNATVILMEPFIMAYPKKLFNWMLVTKRFVNVVDRLAAKYNTGLVKLWDIFNKADASILTIDGIHITPEGHRLITEAWLEEYRRILAVQEQAADNEPQIED
jgi:lysophospholipase L1-like esterase